jgi:protein TonB
MAAAPTPSLVSKREPTVLPGGNLTPGTPTDHQGTGNQTTPPPSQPTPEPSSAPQPVAPPAPQPTPPEPAPAPEPKPAPDPPKPAGPTQDAQPSNQVKPEIPDDLKQQQYKSFVRVKVTVSADGSFVPTLRTSSGNADIDARVLNALKQWKWKPALKDGTPIDSVAYFRFEFEVN